MPVNQRILVVCWEGADWGMLHPLVDAGLMPHFEALVNGGTIGELATLQPQLDPMLLASLATGCRGDRHDVRAAGSHGKTRPPDHGRAHRDLWSYGDSNPRPPPCHGGPLPTAP